MSALASRLQAVLTKAVAWGEERAEEISEVGAELSPHWVTIARTVGVREPGKVRVLVVDHMPLPEDSELRSLALETGLLGPGMVGLTLGHGIYVCRGHASARLLAHEFRHVHQYEAAGS